MSTIYGRGGLGRPLLGGDVGEDALFVAEPDKMHDKTTIPDCDKTKEPIYGAGDPVRQIGFVFWISG